MRRLWALGIPLAGLAQCEPQCAPAPDLAPAAAPAPQEPRWTVDWDAVAWCESGGRWDHRPVTNSTGTYSGGLMIGHRWWVAHRGDDFASAPYLASKSEQIIVAERIVDANGGGYAGADRGWQCVP